VAHHHYLFDIPPFHYLDHHLRQETQSMTTSAFKFVGPRDGEAKFA